MFIHFKLWGAGRDAFAIGKAANCDPNNSAQTDDSCEPKIFLHKRERTFIEISKNYN